MVNSVCRIRHDNDKDIFDVVVLGEVNFASEQGFLVRPLTVPVLGESNFLILSYFPADSIYDFDKYNGIMPIRLYSGDVLNVGRLVSDYYRGRGTMSADGTPSLEFELVDLDIGNLVSSFEGSSAWIEVSYDSDYSPKPRDCLIQFSDSDYRYPLRAGTVILQEKSLPMVIGFADPKVATSSIVECDFSRWIAASDWIRVWRLVALIPD